MTLHDSNTTVAPAASPSHVYTLTASSTSNRDWYSQGLTQRNEVPETQRKHWQVGCGSPKQQTYTRLEPRGLEGALCLWHPQNERAKTTRTRVVKACQYSQWTPRHSSRGNVLAHTHMTA